MAQFKIGDKVRPIEGQKNQCRVLNRKKWDYITITDVYSTGDYGYDAYLGTQKVGSCYVCYKDEHLELINKKSFMKKISIMMKKLLSADMQEQVKAGYLNGDLELTSEGKEALLSLLYTDKANDLTAMAKAVNAEVEAK